MIHTMLRPCIVKVSVLGYFPLYTYTYFYRYPIYIIFEIIFEIMYDNNVCDVVHKTILILSQCAFTRYVRIYNETKSYI